MLPLTPELRRSDLTRMADGTFDVLVVGGGITGAGIALDAASRGLSVALVERDDFASGTSGRSSRMIHGGLRYLEHLEVGLVREALRERAILLRLAPHLVRPVRFYVPEPSIRRRALLGSGLTLYDALAAGRNVRRHRRAGTDEVARAVPGFEHPTRALTYPECRTDDARLTLAVIGAARSFGAVVANHAEVTTFQQEAASGRVTGAGIRDAITGEGFDVRARAVANATGVWADRVRALGCSAPELMRPSKGIHLVFRPGAIRTTAAVGMPAGDGRHVFVMPWADRTYAGTSDTPYQGDLDDPAVTPDDVDYLLEPIARAFPGVTAGDVVSSWAGLRPLLDRGDAGTTDLSRRHSIDEEPPGLFTITGGKLTTYRAMAEDLVDRLTGALGVRSACRTREILLGLTVALPEAIGRAESEAATLGLGVAAARRLVYRFGDDWTEALAMIRKDRSMAEPLADGLPILAVEARIAREREMALTDEDVLVRRTRLTTLDANAVSRVAPWS